MFRSFFLAGFEGSTGFNRHGQWFDQVRATGHDRSVDEDYRRLADLGIRGVREVIALAPHRSRRRTLRFFVRRTVHAGCPETGIEVIWDLFHYGFPQHVDLWSEDFPTRFADYCFAAARYAAARTDHTFYFTPVNEPSFMAFAAGERGLFAPRLYGSWTGPQGRADPRCDHTASTPFATCGRRPDGECRSVVPCGPFSEQAGISQ